MRVSFSKTAAAVAADAAAADEAATTMAYRRAVTPAARNIDPVVGCDADQWVVTLTGGEDCNRCWKESYDTEFAAQRAALRMWRDTGHDLYVEIAIDLYRADGIGGHHLDGAWSVQGIPTYDRCDGHRIFKLIDGPRYHEFTLLRGIELLSA